jgi:hypothetical protein
MGKVWQFAQLAYTYLPGMVLGSWILFLSSSSSSPMDNEIVFLFSARPNARARMETTFGFFVDLAYVDN